MSDERLQIGQMVAHPLSQDRPFQARWDLCIVEKDWNVSGWQLAIEELRQKRREITDGRRTWLLEVDIVEITAQLLWGRIYHSNCSDHFVDGINGSKLVQLNGHRIYDWVKDAAVNHEHHRLRTVQHQQLAWHQSILGFQAVIMGA